MRQHIPVYAFTIQKPHRLAAVQGLYGWNGVVSRCGISSSVQLFVSYS